MDKKNHEMRAGNILVVDDDIEWQLILSICLESAGFDVTATSDGNKALEILENNNFRSIITDFNMPEMNGVELAIKVRKRHPATPVRRNEPADGAQEVSLDIVCDSDEINLVCMPVAIRKDAFQSGCSALDHKNGTAIARHSS